jgi:D-alanyl-D-alanine carboxypeptidase (penicillin-binding protein 5/6)
MRKLKAIFLALFLLNLGIFNGAEVFAMEISDGGWFRLTEEETKEVVSPSVYVYNSTEGREMYARSAEEKRAVASLTKIMTAYTFLKNYQGSLNDKVTVKSEMLGAPVEYVDMGLYSEQVVTVRDLLYGVLLPSGADAAEGLAVTLSGSVEDFVKQMNREVGELGLKNTHFDNPVGIDSAENYATAKEIGVILAEALKNADFREAFKSTEYTTSFGKKLVKTMAESAEKHGLDISAIKGAKTGYTGAAGRCLASIGEVDGEEIIIVNLGAEGVEHISDPTKIYGKIGEVFEEKILAKAGEKVTEVPIWGGKNGNYNVKVTEEVKGLMRKDAEAEVKYEGVDEIGYWTPEGTEIGKIKVLINGEEAGEMVVNTSGIEYINIPMIVGGVVVILGVILIVKRRKVTRRR